MNESAQCKEYHDYMLTLRKMYKNANIVESLMIDYLYKSIEHTHYKQCVIPEIKQKINYFFYSYEIISVVSNLSILPLLKR